MIKDEQKALVYSINRGEKQKYAYKNEASRLFSLPHV